MTQLTRTTGWTSRRLVYLRDLLRELVLRDVRLRYKRSLLGIAWSLLNPLSQLVVFNFVFTRLLPLGIPDYTLFLFIGLLAWSWFQSSLVAATATIVENRALIARPGFPAAILPVVIVTVQLIHLLLALPVLFGFMWLVDTPLTPVALLLPLVIVVQFALTLALSYFLAAWHVRFRDVQYLVGVVTLLLFYLTPILYESARVPADYETIFRLNPLLHLLDAYRALLIEGRSPDAAPLVGVALLSAVLLVAGYRIFIHESYRFAEEL